MSIKKSIALLLILFGSITLVYAETPKTMTTILKSPNYSDTEMLNLYMEGLFKNVKK